MLLRTLEEGRKGVVAVMVAVLVLIKKSRATFKSWLITHTHCMYSCVPRMIQKFKKMCDESNTFSVMEKGKKFLFGNFCWENKFFLSK